MTRARLCVAGSGTAKVFPVWGVMYLYFRKLRQERETRPHWEEPWEKWIFLSMALRDKNLKIGAELPSNIHQIYWAMENEGEQNVSRPVLPSSGNTLSRLLAKCQSDEASI